MRTCSLSVFLLLVLAITITLACGSPAFHIAPNCSATATGANTGGILQSVMLCPASADARNFPDGEVQFVATGYYGTPPSPVTPLTATWGACYQGNSSTGISVSNKGLAKCEAGAVGTYTVWAWAPSGAPACPAWVGQCGQGGCQVVGTAQLTCP